MDTAITSSCCPLSCVGSQIDGPTAPKQPGAQHWRGLDPICSENSLARTTAVTREWDLFLKELTSGNHLHEATLGVHYLARQRWIRQLLEMSKGPSLARPCPRCPEFMPPWIALMLRPRSRWR
jgi:hypothetical protein